MKKISCIVVLSVVLAACQKDAKQINEDAEQSVSANSQSLTNPRAGYVYTMSNDAGGNSILVYKQNSNGKLTYQSSTMSGGNGAGAGLGSQGSVVINKNHQWLYAVNAGSNSVSSFAIHEDGGLTLAHTISSNGTMPVSISVHGSWLYVVNSTSSNISGFTVGSGGSLTLIAGSNQPLSAANAGPAQISFTPGGQKLIVTEKMTNKITAYPVNNSGVAGASNSQNSAGQTPFGFEFSGSNYIVVTEASGGIPNASTISTYSVAGSTTLAEGPVANGQTAACWTDVTRDGKYAYVTNTGSNTISLYEVGSNGSLHLINAIEAETGMTPIDIVISANEFYVYNLNAGSHSISQFRKGNNSSLNKLGDVAGLPPFAVGLAAY